LALRSAPRSRPSLEDGGHHKRFEEFALSLHPDKTRLIEFGRHAADRRARCGFSKPETFNFLGFTFICGRSRRGNFPLKRKSRRDRVRAKLKEIKEDLWRRMHWSIPEQGSWLAQVIRGFFAYHAVPTNFAALSKFSAILGARTTLHTFGSPRRYAINERRSRSVSIRSVFTHRARRSTWRLAGSIT